MTPDAAAQSSSHDSARVLVVDDESNITDLVTTALRYEGFEVASAHDGREALAAVDSFRPDLIVLDVMLPDLDGFEVQRRLLDRGRPTPVVFLTARDATEDKVRGLTIGGDDYVTKPFSPTSSWRASDRSYGACRARPPWPNACGSPTSRWTRTRTRSGAGAARSSSRPRSSACFGSC
jgi:CheY-like chemotaxis protein